MIPEIFQRMQQAYAAGGADAAFNQLIETLRAEKNYDALFDVLLMRRRHELGLSLLNHPRISSLDPATRKEYEEAYVAACRQVGDLYLEAGDLPQAWRYFRTIGEPDKVQAALKRIDDNETNVEGLINLAYGEGLDPRLGFAWILKHFGVCRAITSYDQYPPGAEGKHDCAGMLTRELYQELFNTLRQQIELREGAAPDTARVAELLQGREWLYEDSYLIDVSHLAAVARFSIELEDKEILRMALELADYGSRLSDTGFYSAGVSVQSHLKDCRLYLSALLGENVEEAVAAFRRKVVENSPDAGGIGPAPLLVYLLVRLGRFDEALQVSLEHLVDVPSEELRLCPSIAQLCQMSNNLDHLLDYAQERHDVLTFMAGLALKKA